jgi:phosphate acyltransferase
MSKSVTIAIDAMGGDVGPAVTVRGASLTRKRYPDVRFVFFGNEAAVRPILDADSALNAVSTFHHTEVSVRMDDKPSQALRSGRNKSSMWCALDAVKQKHADVAVSAGNTGALMAMAKFCLRTMEGVDRPVIAAIWPTLRGESIVLDVGASIGADEDELIAMALMGASMARVLFAIEEPTVGLLNVGVEEVKGLEPIRAAGKRLRDMTIKGMRYEGFIEGDDIGKGNVDVVVTEGFAGNIALKTAEGTAKQISAYLRAAMSQSLSSKVGYLLAKSAFSTLKEKMDPRKVNGGVFLGLNGIVIKSHGGTDAEGFASAVDLAYDMARHNLIEKITASFTEVNEQMFIEQSLSGQQSGVES